MISGAKICKIIWSIWFQKFWILDNLVSEIWCPILFCLYFDSLMLNRNGFEIKTCLKMSQSPKMVIASLFIILNFWNLIPHIVLLISQLPDKVRKSFCTPVRAMYLSFQMKSSIMFVARQITQTLKRKFSDFFLPHPLAIQ